MYLTQHELSPRDAFKWHKASHFELQWGDGILYTISFYLWALHKDAAEFNRDGHWFGCMCGVKMS